MIFVTVGTHEQQFDRLIQKIDQLKEAGAIQENVIMQIGFSTYEPQFCEWKRLLPYSEMQKMYKEARIIITHGGPASFMSALQIGKIPVVVPRQRQYQEHVNDHQVYFAKAVSERMGNIIAVYDAEQLKQIIINYTVITESMNLKTIQNNELFCKELENIVEKMFGK